MFKKRSTLSKYWLKYTNRRKYKEYKWEQVNYAQFQYTNFMLGENRMTDITKIKATAEKNGRLTLTHSGNAGDIIYALATIKRIHEITNVPVHLYLKLGQKTNLRYYNNHPLGGVMMNEKMASMLKPLLVSQTYIASCENYSNEEIDIDLDYFRTGLIPQDRGNIGHWVGYITGVTPQLWKNWLTVVKKQEAAEYILIARSARYQNQTIDYSFISQYQNLKFIGVESEFNEMKKMLPSIEWLQVGNFLDLAQIIAGCKFFIGNQSFPYSLAEALKAPRILEVCFEVINVIPEGENGYDFFFQEHFEWLVKDLSGNN